MGKVRKGREDAHTLGKAKYMQLQTPSLPPPPPSAAAFRLPLPSRLTATAASPSGDLTRVASLLMFRDVPPDVTHRPGRHITILTHQQYQRLTKTCVPNEATQS